MAMLSGNYSIVLDAKGRITIPTVLREALGPRCQLSINGDFSTIAFYPESTWTDKMNMLATIPETDAVARKYIRLVLGNAFPVEPDSQGRVLIPPTLREKAHLSKNVRLVGMGDSVEIWDEEIYLKNQESDIGNADMIRSVNEMYFAPYKARNGGNNG